MLADSPAAPPLDPPAPRRRWPWLVLCLALLLGGLFYLHHEVLFSGAVYHMDDAADGYYPSRTAAWRTMLAGHLPVWERGSSTGWPINVDPYYGAFYPLSVIFYLTGMVRGLGFSIVFHMLLAACGMLWLLRRRGLDWGPALLGAASLGFSSFMVCRIRHIIFPQLLAWLPFILVGVEGYLASRKRRELLLVALAFGMCLLCGALPLMPFLAMFLIAYIVPRVCAALEPWRPRCYALGMLVLAGVVGLALGMVTLLPTIAHMPESPRSLGASYQFASSYAWPNFRYLATLIAADVFGVEERGRWFGVYNHWEMAGYYAGALVVLLAPFGLARRRRPELIGLALVSLIGVCLAFGDKGPLQHWFFAHIPLYAALRCPTRALVMFLAAVPILSAEGLTWLCDRPLRRRWLLGGIISLAVLVAGAMGYYLLDKIVPRELPPVTMTRHALAHLVAVVAIGGALLALILTRCMPRRAGMILFALLTLGELVVIDRGYLQPQPGDWAPGTERFAAVDWLAAQKPQDRFLPAADGPFRLLNLGMTYNLEGASGYSSMQIWRYSNLLWAINHGAPYPKKAIEDDLAASVVRRFDTPLIDLLNVRWFIGTWPPARKWIERYRPAPREPLHARHEPDWDRRLRVFENPSVMPRAFVAFTARVETNNDQQLTALLASDPRREVILDRAPSPAPVGDSRPYEAARITAADNLHLKIEADASAPGILVVSEAYYPGWSATLDGRPAALLRADYAFRGIALPAGHHSVEMRFRSRPTEVGLALSGMGILGLAGLGLLRRRRHK